MSMEKDEMISENDASTESIFLIEKNDPKKENHPENVELTTLSPYHRKPYLGGYQHKLTGAIYHHAVTQTRPPPWKYGLVERFNRDAQTVTTRNKEQQTSVDASTQVAVRNIFMLFTGETLLEATGNYEFADEIKEKYEKKVIIVQKYARRWLAQRELYQRKKAACLKILWDKEQDKLRRKKGNDYLMELQKRKLNPINEEDFALLFCDLQKWWESEANTISQERMGADFKAAMLMLVEAESKKIEEIHRQKTSAENTKYLQIRQRLLNIAARPKTWKAYKGEVQVETASTLKGQSFYNLYLTLSMKHISAEDRIDALTSLKELLQPYRSYLTHTITQLANREIDLILRGTKEKHLEGLRSRIQDLFWQYAKQPIVNPEMQKVNKMKKTDGTPPHILCCAACKQFYILKPNATDDVLSKSVLENCFEKCKKCLYLENEGWMRKDLELHKRLMKSLIDEEERKGSVSSILYFLQPNDIGHLVEKVWRRQSCLSGSVDELQLEFIRYNPDEEWTPWNCMLVNKQEALTLAKVPFSETKYDKNFKKRVAQKHAAARSYFSSIPRFLPFIPKSSVNLENYFTPDDESD